MIAVTERCGILFTNVVVFSTNETAHQPPSTEVFRVDDPTSSKLDSLSGPVYPGKVDVKGSLNDAENRGYGIEITFRGCSDYPVEDIEATIRAQGNEVKGVDDSWYCCLPQQQELGENAN